MPIQETLPGSEYRLCVDDGRVANAKLFVSRIALTKHCSTLLQLSNPTIAEVGVFHGHFSQILLDIFSPSKLYLIDTFYVNDHITHKFDAAHHFPYVKNRFKDLDTVEFLPGLSWDMLASIPNNTLDYIYIDADHTYASVTNDINVAVQKIKPGGIIQFNDYCTTHGYGVLEAVNEFIEENDVDILGLSIDRSGYHDLAVRLNKSIEPNLVIVTPCSRPENLEAVKDSINFDRIKAWYIIYDTRNVEFLKRFQHEKIIELECKDEGVVGHQIRNMALCTIQEGIMYFLDDDNIIHPNFWNISGQFCLGRIFTFDMIRNNCSILLGNNPVPNLIDVSQYAFDVRLVGDLRFDETAYNADGQFIKKLHNQCNEQWTYIQTVAAFYNKLRL